MINVIYLVSRLKQSGPINQAFNIVTGMEKTKCNMIVVTLSPELEQSKMQMYRDADIEVIQLNRREGDVIGCVKDIKRIIRERNIDIVHSSGDRPDFCNLFLRKHVTTVSTLRSEVDNIAERKGWFVNLMAKVIYKMCIKVVNIPVACSHFLAESIGRSTGRKIKVIHNCVNTDIFRPSENKQRLKASLGIAPNKTVYLSLGSIIKRKNNDILLNYFFNKHDEESVFVLAGDGELLDYYKSKYDSPNIVFTGRVDALPYLQAADYLVSASLSEGLPNTVLESIACGVPVILSDIGPHKEILREGEVGMLFDNLKSDSLDAAIKEIAKRNYKELSKNCLKMAEDKFSKKTTANNYLELYNNAISIRKRSVRK